MTKSSLEFKVQYSDTDSYKVAWHGSYLRWMEAGRVDWLYLIGVDIKKLDEDFNTVMPVVDLQIKYLKSAKLLEDVIVETTVDEITNLYIIFDQKVINKKTNEILTTAKVKGVAVKEGKLLRNLKTLLNKE
ncbi:TPA: acyl-CoA thioesterase [Candidatus Galligastranaerophilus intestinigallinarum]|nr:acyl-CoA thioesterase [Candidatus Galligastranaerophilus intestinigallinarum]